MAASSRSSPPPTIRHGAASAELNYLDVAHNRGKVAGWARATGQKPPTGSDRKHALRAAELQSLGDNEAYDKAAAGAAYDAAFLSAWSAKR